MHCRASPLGASPSPRPTETIHSFDVTRHMRASSMAELQATAALLMRFSTMVVAVRLGETVEMELALATPRPEARQGGTAPMASAGSLVRWNM